MTNILDLLFCTWIHRPLLTSYEIIDELAKHDDTFSLQGTTCIPSMTQMFSRPILEVWDHQFYSILLHLELVALTSWILILWSFIIYITRSSIPKHLLVSSRSSLQQQLAFFSPLSKVDLQPCHLLTIHQKPKTRSFMMGVGLSGEDSQPWSLFTWNILVIYNIWKFRHFENFDTCWFKVSKTLTSID